MFKLLLIGATVGVLSNLVGATASGIIVAASAVMGSVYLGSKTAQVLKLTARLLRHWLGTVQLLQALPSVLEQLTAAVHGVEERLGSLEEKADAIQEPMTAVARELDVSHRAPADRTAA